MGNESSTSSEPTSQPILKSLPPKQSQKNKSDTSKSLARPLPPPGSRLNRTKNSKKATTTTWRSFKHYTTTAETTTPKPSYATFSNGIEKTVTCRSENPTVAWENHLSKTNIKSLQVLPVNPTSLTSTNTNEWNSDTHIRVVCISDTHGKHRKMTSTIPKGDILIHAGDFTNVGHTSQVQDVCDWLANMSHPHKILISGNHDVTLDEDYYTKSWKRWHHKGKNNDVQAREIVRKTQGITYLEDESILLEGYKFYGTPWQPEFCDWAFNLDRGFPCKLMWDKIETDVDILISHGPPIGHGDLLHPSGERSGCVDLLNTVTERVKPLYHVFGHIHESYGITTNETTTFINASTCTHSYRPNNPPIVFDLPRKQ